MKIYRASYEIQEGLNPRLALERECEKSRSTIGTDVFTKDEGLCGTRSYFIDEDTDRITEIYDADTFYILISAVLSIYAVALWFPGLGNNIFIEPVHFIAPITAVTISSLPYILINDHPDGFRTANYPTKQNFNIQPVVFREYVSYSKITYLNFIATGVILYSQIFVEITILALVYPLGIIAIIMMARHSHDPVTNKTAVVSLCVLAPFAIALANLFVFKHWEQITEINNNAITSSFYLTDLAAFLQSSPIVGLIFTNSIFCCILMYVKYDLDSPSDPFDMYTAPSTIDNKVYFRIGIVLLSSVYILTILVILISHVIGSPIIPVESPVSMLLIYWPVFILIPVWIFIWRNQQNPDSLRNDPLFEINGVPVVLDTENRKPAFAVSDSTDPVIVVSQNLRDQLSKHELLAICYHELYHIEYGSVKPQNRIQLPIIGPVLFFLSTDLSALYNEEYHADEFAAQKVGVDAVVRALEKAQSLHLFPRGSIIQNEINKGWAGYARLFCSLPVLSLYSPPVEHRINRLEKTQ